MQTKKHAARRGSARLRGGAFKKNTVGIITVAVLMTAVIITACIAVSNKDNLMKTQYPTEYINYVERYSKEYKVERSLVFGVIRTESGFDENAGSSAGALGLMQIIPETFDWLCLMRNTEQDYTTEDLFEPEVNIDYGTYFLRYLLDKYGNEETAVAAYNAGFGAVDEWLENSEYSSDGVSLDYIPYPETREYVKKVMQAKNMYKELYNY